MYKNNQVWSLCQFKALEKINVDQNIVTLNICLLTNIGNIYLINLEIFTKYNHFAKLPIPFILIA